MTQLAVQYLDGAALPFEIKSIRELPTRWTDFIRRLSREKNRDLVTVMYPSYSNRGVVSGDGTEPEGAYCVLEKARAMIAHDDGTRNIGSIPAWSLAWAAVHPWKLYPFDLRHGPHIDEAMAFMSRFTSWSRDEVGKVQRTLREEVAQWMAREMEQSASNAAPQMREVTRILRDAMRERHGGIQNRDALKRMQRRRAFIPELRLAQARAKVMPTDKNKAEVARLMRIVHPVRRNFLRGIGRG